MPLEEDIPTLERYVEEARKDGGRLDTAAAKGLFRERIRSRAYDTVYNGNELASGSIRIHEPRLQEIELEALGIGPDEEKNKFGFLLEAFHYGEPPHGGFEFGLDELMQIR